MCARCAHEENQDIIASVLFVFVIKSDIVVNLRSFFKPYERNVL